jgi:hypothetical protein
MAILIVLRSCSFRVQSVAHDRFWLAVIVAAVSAWISGCGSGRPTCHPVRGEVFVLEGSQRTPATGAVITFHPAGSAPNTAKPTARVGEDGSYTLTTYDGGDGAQAGEYTVTVEWVPPRPPPPHKPTQTGDRLKGRYSDPVASTIKYTVEKGKDNVVPTIELKMP